jgi:hypothetical protein
MYASIDCGVKGMNIVPKETDSEGRCLDNVRWQLRSLYFANTKKRAKFMFEYSSFQRTIID